jgi:hypothetical protein
MKHLKLFNNIQDLENYKSSDNYVLPNVSLTKDDYMLYFNDNNTSAIVYAIAQESYSDRGVLYSLENVKSLKIDNEYVDLDTIDIPFSFYDENEHTMEIELIDETVFPKIFSNYNPQQTGSGYYAPMSLKKVILPNTIETISDCALAYNNLTEIILNSPLKTIGEYAFFNCRALMSTLDLSSVKTIGKQAFYSCGINLLAGLPSLETIGSEAFFASNISGELDLKSIQTIGNNAFYGTNISKVIIGENCQTINGRAFSYNQSLQYIYVPETTTLDVMVFSNCYNIEEATINCSLNNYTFDGCNSIHVLNLGPKCEVFKGISNINTIDKIFVLGDTAPTFNPSEMNRIPKNVIVHFKKGVDYSTWENYFKQYNWIFTSI